MLPCTAFTFHVTSTMNNVRVGQKFMISSISSVRSVRAFILTLQSSALMSSNKWCEMKSELSHPFLWKWNNIIIMVVAYHSFWKVKDNIPLAGHYYV